MRFHCSRRYQQLLRTAKWQRGEERAGKRVVVLTLSTGEVVFTSTDITSSFSVDTLRLSPQQRLESLVDLSLEDDIPLLVKPHQRAFVLPYREEGGKLPLGLTSVTV
jgi:hypothetical protein